MLDLRISDCKIYLDIKSAGRELAQRSADNPEEMPRTGAKAKLTI